MPGTGKIVVAIQLLCDLIQMDYSANYVTKMLLLEMYIFEKLKERNNKIKDIVASSYKLDLEEALNNNYLDKFYYECRL